MDIVVAWLARYDWFTRLPQTWKQVAHRLVVELSAEKFTGLPALHEALSAQDLSAVWDALENEDLPDKTVDMIDAMVGRK
jgi:hypothetical protein